ncbi:MAG: stalk domain-containing protein [Tissierellia bacterium]|nr:stalk domain-containing protein [Tissierellia bacterium]
MKKFRMCLLIVLFGLCLCTTKTQARKVNIIVQNIDITDKSETIIERDRLMVPVRFVSEALGKRVSYVEHSQEVIVEDVTGKVTLRIGSHLVELTDGSYFLSDVAAKAVNGRTYVPIRVIAEAFGLAVGYDEGSNTVSIGEGQPSQVDSYQVEGFASTLRDQTVFRVTAGANVAPRIATTKLFVLDSLTKKGFVNDSKPGMEVTYVPWDLKKFSILLVASYDANGNIVAGRGRKVSTEIEPRVSLGGIVQGQTYHGSVELQPQMNFVAKSAAYSVTDLMTNVTQTFDKRDPYGPWNFQLNGGEEKSLSIVLKVTDMEGKEHTSEPIQFFLSTPRSLHLIGVKPGDVINGTKTINVSRNFDVTSTRYYLQGPLGDLLLAEKPYGAHVFNPGAHISGEFNLRAEVDLPNGETLTTDAVAVRIQGGKRLLLQGIGPKAVINEEVELYYDSNVALTSLEYVLKGPKTIRVVGSVGGKTKYRPEPGMDGSYTMVVEGQTAEGPIRSEEIAIRIHTGKIYKSRPVVEKDKFLESFSPLALAAQQKTSMAASIQMAQAILETGWGQYVPVDKYSGKASKNLFGIKGKASNGSVISNTWEEYNGVRYRIDDAFRAYNTLQESWDDHKALLLTKERYGIFRDVMFDPYRGAWAIRRAGYATDSAYPGKLIDIIEKYQLRELDAVDFQ